MNRAKSFASLIGGIGLVVVFFAWLALRDELIATVSSGFAISMVLHGVAWLVLIGGVSFIATALTTRPPKDAHETQWKSLVTTERLYLSSVTIYQWLIGARTSRAPPSHRRYWRFSASNHVTDTP